jgi:hypothetical protein
MASDALICFLEKNVADYGPSATKSRAHTRQLALSCDAVVLLERAPDLVSKLSIFSSGQSLCDLIRPRCRVDPANTLWTEIHQLPDLEFVFGHDGVRLYGSLDQFDRLDDRGIVILRLVDARGDRHIRIGSAGNGLIRSPGSGSSLSQQV